MMYWLALTEGSYKQYIDNIAKQEQERQALEASTVDKVQPGEQQPETDHKWRPMSHIQAIRITSSIVMPAMDITSAISCRPVV